MEGSARSNRAKSTLPMHSSRSASQFPLRRAGLNFKKTERDKEEGGGGAEWFKRTEGIVLDRKNKGKR